MKNQNISKDRSTIGITSYLAVSLPIISCIVILLSYNIDGLDMVLSTISSLVDYSGFKTDGGWYFRLLLLLPVISISHYIGFKMLQNQETTFEIQLLQGLSITLYTIIISIFFIGVGWVLAVYVTRAFSYMHFFGNPIERFNQIISVNPYLRAYDLLSNYIWTNIAIFYIALLVFIIIQFVLSKTLYAKKIELFFSQYMTEKANNNRKIEGIKSSKDELNELDIKLKKLKTFESSNFFNKNHTFIARDIENKKPIYIDDKKIINKELPHFAIVGASSSGKGVFSQVFLVQMILKNQSVIVFDPNDDDHMMKNLKYNAERMGKKFHLIDFNDYEIPQIDILQQCKKGEFRRLTNVLFPALKIRNSEGNYHAKFSRKARRVYEKVLKEADEVKCMYDLHKQVFEIYNEDYFRADNGDIPQFVQEFLDFADIPMFKVKESISIAKAIENGDVIYVSCPEMSEDDEITYLCKAFFVRVLQIIKSRKLEDTNHVFLFVDEFAEFVNKTVKAAIKKIRKKRCTMVMNMTSFESLAGLQSDVDGNSVIDTVKINSIKLIYEQPHESISEKASKMTGEKIVNIEHNHIKRNEALQEINQIMETTQIPQKINIYSATMLVNLPPKVGIFVGQGLPRLVQTEVLKYPESVEFPTVLQVEPYSANDSETDSEDDNDIMGAL